MKKNFKLFLNFKIVFVSILAVLTVSTGIAMAKNINMGGVDDKVIFNVANVGIGTTNPARKLSVVTATTLDGIEVVNGTAYATIYPKLGDGNYNPMVEANDSAIIFSQGTQDTGNFTIAPWSSSTAGLRITNTGNVGIGTPAPEGTLEVTTGTGNVDAILTIESDTDNNDEDSNPRVVFKQDGGAVVGRVGFADNANSFEVTSQYAENLYLGTSNSIDMTINSDGKVGINDTTPSYRLDVNGSGRVTGTLAVGTPVGTYDATTKSYVDDLFAVTVYGDYATNGIFDAPATWSSSDASQYRASFWDANGATWTPDANWWWGITLPHRSNSSSYNYAGQIIMQNNTTPTAYMRTITNKSPGSWARVWLSTTADTNNFSTSGSVTASAFLYSSDASLKKNIETVDSALDKVLALRGVTFDWKDSDVSAYGFIAQEVEEVLPELVSDEEIKSVQYGNITAVLVEAVKEQQKQIEELREELRLLKK